MENTIKRLLLSLGADDCGIANVERFEGAPCGFHPRDIYCDCKSVIVFLKRLPKGLMETNPRICYTHATDTSVLELDRIALIASLGLEDLGALAVPLPCDSPYDSWDEQTLTGKGLLSMRHAAKLAGLGSLGKNTLLVHREYGNMVNIGAVLTNLDLKSDPLCEEFCLPECRICIESCPVHALDGTTVNQSLCRPYTCVINTRGYAVFQCNQCRLVCPRRFGVHL